MLLTRERAIILERFGHLPFHSDSDSGSHFENSSAMSGSNTNSNGVHLSLSYKTNPFALNIDLKDKIGNTIFCRQQKEFMMKIRLFSQLRLHKILKKKLTMLLLIFVGVLCAQRFKTVM